MPTEHFDIAIIGGGVSGVYSAWKLKKAHPDKRIVVFEGSDHIGGRLLSVQPPDIDNMVAELGGMRILPAVQPLITKLLLELNHQLPADQKIETYDFPVDEPQNIAFLRGVHLRLSDFTEHPERVPYHLNFLEKGSTSGQLIIDAIEQIVPGITNPDLKEEQRREMVQAATFAGKPLYQQGFWNVLMRIITGEAYQLGVDAGGYNSTLSNWNCADAIPWFLSDFGVDPNYKGFKKGFQQVPLALAQLFEQAGGMIRLNAKMQGFSHTGRNFEMLIDNKKFHADQLILAMPRRSLELLSATSQPLQDTSVQQLIGSVTPRPLFKLFTTYTSPWWRNAGYNKDDAFVAVESGRSLTDLPVRQTYYWPTDQGEPAQGGPSMLMASYDDGDNIGFWDGLRPKRGQAWQEGREVTQPENPFEGTAQQDCTWQKYRAAEGMVTEVARQLASIHDLKYTPDVQNAAFRDWGDDPFGGGWNSWNIGVKSWEVKEKVVQPVRGMAMYICGESYSDAQGWVEGALQTADMMLAKMDVKSGD